MTQVYASASCILAGLAGLAFSGLVFGAWAPPAVIGVIVVLGALLAWDAQFADAQRKQTLDSWHENGGQLLDSAHTTTPEPESPSPAR